MSGPGARSWRPWLASALLCGLLALLLRAEGRLWWCACGEPFLWSGDVQSRHNSQHLADPYSLTHVSHGLIFFALFTTIGRLREQRGSRPLSTGWRLFLAVFLEAAWELLENSPIVIDRYRTATMSLGYSGDTVANSLGDV